MKFTIFSKVKSNLLVITLLSYIAVLIPSILSLKTKASEKSSMKSETKLDYLSYISKMNEEKDASTNNKDTSNKDFKFKSKEINDFRKKPKYTVAVDEVLEDWFTISSDEFHNIKRFPPIKIPTGEITTIQTNALNFRLNSAINCTDSARPMDDRLFYFRLTKNSLYYSATKTDLNVLGYITITDVSDIDKNVDISGLKEYFCFNTKDDLFKEWKVCNENKLITEKWYCTIKQYLGLMEAEDICWGIPKDPNTIYKEKTIKKPIIMVPLASPTCNENWDYQRSGDDWECDCKEGVEQSPIDLPTVMQAIESPIRPIFSYNDIEAISTESTIEGVQIQNQKLQFYNTDNKLHVLHYDMGKITTIDGAVYRAQEITFHTPANHKIAGKEYPLEVSFIHYGVTKGDIGKQVILSFLFEAVPGVYNSFLEDLDYFNLPDPINKRRDLSRNLFIPKILYEENSEVNNIPIMKPFSFYTYTGSLPFPPCTERTIHYVSSTPLKASSTTIGLFKEALRLPDLKSKTGEIFSSNKLPSSNRETQPLNGRPVYWYDHQKHCGPDLAPQKPKVSGHYEKVLKRGTQYFYVAGSKPSGLPGAFVVSEKEAKGTSAEQV